MIITKQLKEKLEKQLGESPLAADEIRRVEGLGNLYVSLSLEYSQEEGYRYLYAATINHQKYFFYNSKSVSPN